MRIIVKEVEVSVVIVCMNNLINLFPCLESIITQTQKYDYEIFVIAYLFSSINLELLKSKYINQNGIFQSYNVTGAAFMVKTRVLKELGYFDESYFFCPEDIALSTLANKNGYKCFVNESVTLVHLEGGTAKNLQSATYLAALKGMTIFLGNTFFKKMLIHGIIIFEFSFKLIYWALNISSQNRKPNLEKCCNSLIVLFLNNTPKEIFSKHYYNIKFPQH